MAMTVSSTSSQIGENALSSWIGNPTNIPQTFCSCRSADSCAARCCGSYYIKSLPYVCTYVYIPSIVCPFFLTNVPKGLTSWRLSSESAIPILYMLYSIPVWDRIDYYLLPIWSAANFCNCRCATYALNFSKVNKCILLARSSYVKDLSYPYYYI